MKKYSGPLVLLLALALLLGCNAKKEAVSEQDQNEQVNNKKPHIIFLLTDDQRWDAMGAMGNPIIQTPNLDSLARNGIMFKNAYVTTAICMVSRATILSGQYKSTHQIDNFRANFTPEAFANTYPMLLKKAGYQTGFIGKFGVGMPVDQPRESFDFWAGSEKDQPDYELTDENGDYLHHTDKIGNDITTFLDQVDDEKPFNLSVSFKAPHVQDEDPRQFIIHPRYESYYADVTIPTPELADPKYWESFPEFFRTEENIARERWRMRFETPEMYQRSVKNYYRLITHVDDIVGNMMQELEKRGLADNTVIIFMGDNGFYLGERGLAGKWYGHEESIRVPLVIYDPRNGNHDGSTPEKIALNIDVAPTILSIAGVSIPEGMQGVDLLKMLESNDEALDRKDFFYEHTFLGSPQIPQVEGVVSKDMKYMNFIEHDYEELYDLEKDSMEKENVASDPEYNDALQVMRDRYQELKQKAGDKASKAKVNK